ncbi:transmembrane protein 6/97 [Mycena alexandri]|uniref:Efficient mitochondria targeting-associated protein 19 n=1 Tax=Mycena alexandri TaxID=1745969 RepID=A0AAD6T955_9AGAR|nr:transmembrane protein 6/97 [Mycena alexandri]
MAPKSLTSRPLDLVYFSFFVTHIFASLCMDFQPLYPRALVPGVLRQLMDWYLRTSNDPLLKGVFGRGTDNIIWFKSFLFLEVVFQFPTFFLAARGLWNDSKKIYVLILVYAASTVTTVWPCVLTIVAAPGPSPAALAAGIATLSPDQRAMLLASYVPFCLIPLLMTVDMAFRLYAIVDDTLAAREIIKKQ